MAVFYVFPSRHLLGQRYSELLATLFPDLKHTPWDWPELAESLARQVEEQGSAFVVYREDLDESVDIKDALIAGFGAGAEDQVVEINFGSGISENTYRRWAAAVAAA